MQKGGGKNKGSSFERSICCRLSLWLTDNKREDVLWRSAMSGGRSTVAFAKGKRFASQAGDICSIDPLGNALTDKFMVECKFYSDLNFVGLLTYKGNLAKFWGTAKTQAAQCKKLPMMIAKQNAQPIVVCLSKEGARELAIQLKCILCSPPLNLYIFLLDDFLKYAAKPSMPNVADFK